MAYASWSVVFGEQPSASKWNILGTNDAHFYSFLGDSLTWTAWSGTLTGYSGTPTQDNKYIRIGNTVILEYYISGTSNTTTLLMTLPITADATTYETSTGFSMDNSALQGVPARCYMNSTSQIAWGKTAGTLGWTSSNTKGVRGIHIYQAA